MRAKDRQDVHVLLGMVEFVKAPQHPHSVVRQVNRPVAEVHHNEDGDDRPPARKHADSRQNDPWEASLNQRDKGEGERRDEGRHDERVHER